MKHLPSTLFLGSQLDTAKKVQQLWEVFLLGFLKIRIHKKESEFLFCGVSQTLTMAGNTKKFTSLTSCNSVACGLADIDILCN